MINVYPCGSKCKLRVGGIEGMVSQIYIKFNTVLYEVTTMQNQMEVIYVKHEEELVFDKEKAKVQIGFRSNGINY